MREGWKQLLWVQWITLSCSVPTKSKPDSSFLQEHIQSPLIQAFFIILRVSETEVFGSRCLIWHSGLCLYLLSRPAQCCSPHTKPDFLTKTHLRTTLPPRIHTFAPPSPLNSAFHQCAQGWFLAAGGMDGSIMEVGIPPWERLRIITKLNPGTPYHLSYCSGSSSCCLLQRLKMRT